MARTDHTRGSVVEGGYDTARLSAAQADRAARAAREADALAYLTRRGGLDDIAQMLGLAASPEPKVTRRSKVGGDRP